MTDNGKAQDTVVEHAADLQGDYDDFAPIVAALAASADADLIPRLYQALTRFLDEGNFYGRDLIASILAGIQGIGALPALLRAAARNLADDQDGLRTEIIGLLRIDLVAARATISQLVTADDADLRRVGLWALEFLHDEQDGAAGPRRLVAINDRGLWLGVDNGGTWLVWSHDRQPAAAADRLVWLLPLLERAPDDVLQALGADPMDTPLPALVRFALAGGASSYWRGLALGWLESSWPATDVLDVLAELKDDRTVAQPLRHRALRVWLAARPR